MVLDAAAGDNQVVALRNARHLKLHIKLIGPKPRQRLIRGAPAHDFQSYMLSLVAAFCTDSRRRRRPANMHGCSAQSPMA